MPPQYSNIKTSLIIIVAIIVLFLALGFAIRLISEQKNIDDINDINDAGDNETAGIVLSVIDGDTFETSDGEIVRLLCVDAPELGTTGAEESKNYLSSLILSNGDGNGDLIIERDGVDKYNRTLAWISVNNILINKEIVDNGFGTLFVYDGTDCGKMSG